MIVEGMLLGIIPLWLFRIEILHFLHKAIFVDFRKNILDKYA